MTQPLPETVFTPLEAKDMTHKHIAEAVAFARRHERNLANRNSADAIPLPAYQVRLLSLVVLKLSGNADPEMVVEKVQKPARPKAVRATTPAPKTKKGAPKKTGGASFDNGAPIHTQLHVLPPLTDTQRKVYDAAKVSIEGGTVVTSRGVAETCKLGSHNTAAKALRDLVDLGYLKKVGPKEVLTLA